MTTLIQWPHVTRHIENAHALSLGRLTGTTDAEKVLNYIRILERKISNREQECAHLKLQNEQLAFQLLSEKQIAAEKPKSKLKQRVRDLELKYVEALNSVYQRLDRLEDKE